MCAEPDTHTWRGGGQVHPRPFWASWVGPQGSAGQRLLSSEGVSGAPLWLWWVPPSQRRVWLEEQDWAGGPAPPTWCSLGGPGEAGQVCQQV